MELAHKWDSEDGMASQRSFWYLFSLYLESLVQGKNLKAVEEEILPCLDEFDFLSNCTDDRTCISICRSLQSSGVVRPKAGVDKLLAEKLLSASLSDISRDLYVECISIASELLDRDLEAMISVVRGCASTAMDRIQTTEEETNFVVKRSVVLEEVFDRLDEKRLLDVVR
jgi:hypothetical protein